MLNDAFVLNEANRKTTFAQATGNDCHTQTLNCLLQVADWRKIVELGGFSVAASVHGRQAREQKMKIYSRIMSRLSPLSRIVARTVVYSVAVGLPLIFAYICLAVTVADTWYYVESPIVVLIGCLTFGLAIVVIVAALVGAVTAILTRLLYGRIQDPARLRLLVALVPIAIITAIIVMLLSNDRSRFWPPIIYPFSLRLLDIAGWPLAASVTVGISQIAAHKYDFEMSPRKREAPVEMWRAIPLAKMVLRITLFSIVLSVAARLLLLVAMPERWGADIPESRHIVWATWAGLSQGLLHGNVLAVASMLGFSELRRPRFYRFAMATIALIIAIVYRSNISILLAPSIFVPRLDLPLAVLTFAHDAALICLITISAAWYCREVAAPRRKFNDRPSELQAA